MAPTPETVKFFLTDQNSDPILGVLVRVFDAAGATFITQDVTVDVGGDAVAEVTVDGDDPAISYTIRMSKTGVAFDGSLGDDSKSPQLIEVYSPPASAPTGKNDFDIQGETFTIPTATDPLLCRASGFFRDASGRPLEGLDIEIINQFKPAVAGGDAIMGERLSLRTDEDGYAQVDLYRNGCYSAWVQSIQAAGADPAGAIAFPREIEVPDQSSISLIELLFPIVDTVVYTPDPVSVAEDDSVDVDVVVTATDKRVLTGPAGDDVLYEIDDTEVATVSVQEDKLVIFGHKAGTATLTATRKDQTIVKFPAPAALASLAITVT